MIIGTVRIKPLPERRADVLELFRSVLGLVGAQPGCAAIEILTEEGPEGAIVLLERWETKETFESHLRSESYRRILAAIDLSVNPPEIRFEEVMACDGMELVERLRNACAGPEP